MSRESQCSDSFGIKYVFQWRETNKCLQKTQTLKNTGREKKKRTRITGPDQTKSVRDRLGPPLNLDWSWPQTRKLGIYPWNRQIEGLEPADPKDMTQQELIDEINRLRTYQEEKELGSTDESEEDQQ